MDSEPSIFSFSPFYNEFLNLCRCLGSSKPLEREDAQNKFLPFFQKFLGEFNQLSPELQIEIKSDLYNFIDLHLQSIRWEDRFAGLYALNNLMDHWESEWLSKKDLIEKLVFDKENRIRQQVGEVIRKYTKSKVK